MKNLGNMISLVLLLAACTISQQAAGDETKPCGTFDTEQLAADLQSGYFERGGIELAKAVIVKLKIYLECERR